MITKERRAELREMNDVHAVTKEGMFRINTPEFNELLDDLEEAQRVQPVQSMQYASLVGQLRKKTGKLVRLNKALERISGWVMGVTWDSLLGSQIQAEISDAQRETKS